MLLLLSSRSKQSQSFLSRYLDTYPGSFTVRLKNPGVTWGVTAKGKVLAVVGQKRKVLLKQNRLLRNHNRHRPPRPGPLTRIKLSPQSPNSRPRVLERSYEWILVELRILKGEIMDITESGFYNRNNNFLSQFNHQLVLKTLQYNLIDFARTPDERRRAMELTNSSHQLLIGSVERLRLR